MKEKLIEAIKADFENIEERRQIRNLFEIAEEDYEKEKFYVCGVCYSTWKTKDGRYFLHKDGSKYGKGLLKIVDKKIVDENGKNVKLKDIKPHNSGDFPFYVIFDDDGNENVFSEEQLTEKSVENVKKPFELKKISNDGTLNVETLFRVLKTGLVISAPNTDIKIIEKFGFSEADLLPTKIVGLSWSRNKNGVNALLECLEKTEAILKLSDPLKSMLLKEGFLISKGTDRDTLISVLRELDNLDEEKKSGLLRFVVSGEHKEALVWATFSRVKPSKMKKYKPDGETMTISFPLEYTPKSIKRREFLGGKIIDIAKTVGLELKMY